MYIAFKLKDQDKLLDRLEKIVNRVILAIILAACRVSRKYRFPDVERDKITAKYEAGVLTVTLPKKKDAVATANKIGSPPRQNASLALSRQS